VHIDAQRPRAQTWFSAHTVPHAPQLRGSSVRSTQAPAHDVVPARQVQTPPAQVASVPQTFPHAPQLASSESTAIHTPPQSA
jgi:hypothetical protein